jgi:hypothetical protein
MRVLAVTDCENDSAREQAPRHPMAAMLDRAIGHDMRDAAAA